MDFNLTEEEQLLQDMVGNFIEREYTFGQRRAILESADGWSRATWAQLADLGLLGVGIPEADGGVDAGPIAAMLVMNGIGSGLVLEPFLSTAVVAVAVLRAADDPAHSRELLPAIAAGKAVVVLAHQEHEARHELDRVGTRAERTAGGYVIGGRKAVVTHAQIADELIVSAGTAGGGISLFRVPAGAPGLSVHGYRSLDGQLAADIELDAVELPEGALVGADGAAAAPLERAYEMGIASVCAEAVGAMEVLIDTTTEYLRTRRQFGRPIGRFQALQHRAADMMIHFEQAKSMSYLAAMRCLAADRTERRRALSAAKVVIGRACRFVGQQAVQLHGGMGVTDELSVSHYFKRLTAIELSFGDVASHVSRFQRA
jgi:alkylation response protein AidB-like acyl-CoA dehydrogenase